MEKNLIWITLDSVRADHTSMAGYERDTTPNLQRISEDGLSFSKCISHSLATHPSSGAILTGKPPSRNTVGFSGDALPDSVSTIAEIFRDSGYHTACLSRNSYVSSATGLDRGFNDFEWISSSTIHKVGVRTILKYLLNMREHSAGFSLDTAEYATPFLMNDVAKRWVKSFDEPFFFYLHYNEPHRPYYPPLPYLDKYTDEIEMSAKEAVEFSMHFHYNLEEIAAGGCDLSQEEWEAVRAMYDAEIAYTDEMIGRLFDYIQELELEDTVFVFTADHGELFGEQGMLAHKLVLDDAVTRVPMVVHGLDIDGKEEELVQHSDIMKTIMEDSGLETDEVQGVNLYNEIREFAISQRGAANFDPFLEHNSDFDTSRYHSSPLTALRTHEFKYLKSDGKRELFKLPDEENDASEEYQEVTEEMDKKFEDWLAENGTPVDKGKEGEFSDAMEKQLRDLGYIN